MVATLQDELAELKAKLKRADEENKAGGKCQEQKGLQEAALHPRPTLTTGQLISDRPRIIYYDNFLTREECDAIIQHGSNLVLSCLPQQCNCVSIGALLYIPSILC